MLLACLGATACGSDKSSTGGSSPTSPTPTGFTATGRVVDGVSGAGMAAVTAVIDSDAPVLADSAGTFSISSASSGHHAVSFSGGSAVTRRTFVSLPGANLSVPLIPSSFDLPAFDQMIRTSAARLQRWTTRPPLVLQTSKLTFTNENDNSFVATAEQMSAADADRLIGDLAWALPQLTGGQLSAFASVTQETANASANVAVSRPGVITVARYQGLRDASGFIGYGRWAWQADGTIIAGIVMFDADYDKSSSIVLRALHSHELGHALGYNHVTLRDSTMNPIAQFEPNDFDRAATTLAFQRPTGNTSPDTDPASFSTNSVGGAITWSVPTP